MDICGLHSDERDHATMKNRHLQRSVLLTGVVGLLLAGAYGLCWRPRQHQYALDRQLIVALKKDDTRLALLLLNQGADPNTPCSPRPAPTLEDVGYYLVYHYIMPDEDRFTSIAFMIACGASRDGEDLHVWQRRSNDPQYDVPQLVQAMIQHGAKISGSKYGLTPLHLAVWCGHLKTVRVLLDHSADINAQNRAGQTPLSVGVDVQASSATLRLLLERGADPNLHLRRGPTPLQVAQKNKRADLVALLLRAGAKK